MLGRSNRNELPWTPEAAYVVPTAEKDKLPHASEGVRPKPVSVFAISWFTVTVSYYI